MIDNEYIVIQQNQSIVAKDLKVKTYCDFQPANQLKKD